jgi:hypothetical protein
MPPPRYILLANPQSKRCENYLPELNTFWQHRGVDPAIEVVPWQAIVPLHGNLDGLAVFDRPALLRIESPGRDWEVAKLFLQAGSEMSGECGTDWLTLPYQKGRLVRPTLLYQGFRRVLMGLRSSLDRRSHLQELSCPLAIAELFDKNATSVRLTAAGLPCPPSLAAPHTVDELFVLLRNRGFGTAYVKLNTGSSASAIAVVHACDDPPWAISSVVRLKDGFFSTRRLECHQAEDLRALLGFLLAEGVCVQRGIRMAQIDGENFDVRVVVIHGRPAFTIFRLSSQPMTNLHLGGRRGAFNYCRASIPTRAWLDAIDHCVEAAKLYSCAVVGVDLLFERGYFRHYLLEANAFGDFFPGLVDPQGRTIPQVEIEATARWSGLLEA